MTQYSRRYRIYAVALLTLVYVFYLLDRNAVVVSQELIKAEFGLSDTSMGLITGLLYGAGFALAGLPLGRAVDRYSRKRLLAAVVAIWSSLTVLCGFSSSAAQLMLARTGVGAAEAGGSPNALSILSDMFPPERRGTISSLFYSGASIGGIASFLFGGYIAMHYGWRTVFIVFGLPGILLALLILFTLREPARASAVDTAPAVQSHVLGDTLALFRHPGLGALYVSTGLFMFSSAGVGIWTIPFFMRSYGLDIATTGVMIALGSGLFSLAGMISTGMIFDWARRFGPDGPLKVVALGAVAHVGFGLLTLFSASLTIAIVGLCGMGATASINAGPTNAAISELAPARARGLAFAIYAVVANIIGGGLGPLAVGILSDAIGSNQGGLKWAMVGVLLIQLLAAATFMKAAASFAKATARPASVRAASE